VLLTVAEVRDIWLIDVFSLVVVAFPIGFFWQGLLFGLNFKIMLFLGFFGCSC
jgi:hypothetical protein